jgi:hypothetical protein
MTLRGTESQAKTRLLLTLWEMSSIETEIKKSDLTKRLQRKGEKAADYQPIFAALDKNGAIALKNKMVQLNAKGKQLLAEGLRVESFEFDASIGAKTANALLKWIRVNCATSAINGNGKKSTIASYEDFKPVALEIYDRLNRDFNLDNLVPIYRIRREIGEQVERSNFDQWLLEMQAKDLMQLIGGEMPDVTPDKAEDSVKTKMGAIRYYATLV